MTAHHVLFILEYYEIISNRDGENRKAKNAAAFDN